MDGKNEITRLLASMDAGDSAAVDALMPHVYEQLQQIARRQLQSERSNHTLNATALVHEAYQVLIGNERVDWKNRAHFFGVAAISMRRILIDYARARVAEKRGGGMPIVTYNDEDVAREARAEELLVLDEALSRLAKQNERQALVVTYRFFSGLKHEEIAQILGVSEPTVRRDWRLARAWLSVEMKQD